MNSETPQSSMQCVNCGLSIKQIKRRWMAEESEELRQLLSDWTCKEPEDNDALCSECYNLLYVANESENKSRRFGHKSTCLSCGRSLCRTRTSPMLDSHPEEKLVIVEWTPSHQVKRLERVCWRCWIKANRLVKQKNEVRSQANGVKVKIEPLESFLLLGDGELDIPASPYCQSEDEEEIVPDKNPQPHSISLGTYKRAADTSSRCIFKNCGQSDRALPHRTIVERLLIDYSYYIPTHSRICKMHRINTHKKWRELVNDSKFSDFTVAHLENLCSILKNTRCNMYCKKFESKIKQDDQLCNYLLGVDYTKYEEMLKDILPIKKQVWCVKKSLAMYLMKKHTGFSYDKVSNFFGVRQKYCMKVINKVHKHLASIVASDDSYVAISTVGCDNLEEIVYKKIKSSKPLPV